MKQIHEIQRQILGKLQFADKLHYLEMKPDENIENNQFDFHLKQLIKQQLVEKQGQFYIFTDAGKKYIASYDTQNKKIETGAMNVAWLICTRGKKDSRTLLVYTRKKQPFFGCQGFPAGKIKLGEKIEEGASRELLEETHLQGKPTLKALLHYRTYSSQTEELVQDKFLYMCHFVDPTGEIVNSYEGEYLWIKEKDLFDFLKKPFLSLDDYRLAINLLDVCRDEIIYLDRVERKEDF